jgi:hypothetical protein
VAEVIQAQEEISHPNSSNNNIRNNTDNMETTTINSTDRITQTIKIGEFVMSRHYFEIKTLLPIFVVVSKFKNLLFFFALIQNS